MRTFLKPLLALPVLAIPLFAGALLLEVGSPANQNQEALEKHAVLVARISACRSPEKTTVTATAESVVNGMRKSIPLRVIPLSTSGTFGIAREWPEDGIWAVKVIVTNPDYKDYVPSAVVPIRKGSVQWEAIKHYFHAPTEAEMSASLN